MEIRASRRATNAAIIAAASDADEAGSQRFASSGQAGPRFNKAGAPDGSGLHPLQIKRLLQLAEFFGLWTTATRIASIVGPISYGLITWLAGGNQRIAIVACCVFFVAGLMFLWPMRVQRGREAALGSAQEA